MLLDITLPSVNSDQTHQLAGGGALLDSIVGATAAVPLITTTTQMPPAQMNLPCSKDLIAVLIECFTIIWLGYLSGRFKLISTDAKDLGAYLTTFALPMVIFLNIAQMEISSINLSFLFCMLISKLILFILVTLITLVISYPANFSYSGALSILSTQSNDFALGYPLFKSLYGTTRPAMLDYLNLMGPIQLLIINPLGIAMMEFEKARTKRRLATESAAAAATAAAIEVEADVNDLATGDTGERKKRTSSPICASIDLSFVLALLTNPLIIASLVALAVNLAHGPELPKFVTKVSNTLAASFAAPALFVVGLSMYGKFSLILKNPNDFLLASVLAITKVMILPCIMRTVMLLILPHHVPATEVPYMADFSYLYGLLPAAPGACIIAKQYEVLTNVVSITMLLSTLISAPLMLATAAVIDQAATIRPETTLALLAQTVGSASGLTLVLCLLTLYLLWRSSRRVSYRTFTINSLETILDNVTRAKATHLFTLLLTMTQLVVGIGGLMWLFMDTNQLRPPLPDDPTPGNHLVEDYLDAGERHNSALSEQPPPHSQRYLTAGAGAYLAKDEPAGDVPYGFGAFCTMHFVLSSGAILMARFIVLCIVLTNFAERARSQRFKPLVSSLLMKVYPLLSVAMILSLALESQHLSCSPSESSLPTWQVSIYLRLVFNVSLLCLAIPLFTATFRLDNKTSWRRLNAVASAAAAGMQPRDPTSGGGGGPQAPVTRTTLSARRFVTSSASLTSETSSAITTSTNLDATFGAAAPPGGRRNSSSARHSSIRAPLERLASVTGDHHQREHSSSASNQTLNLVATSRLANSMTTLADCTKSTMHHNKRAVESFVVGVHQDDERDDDQETTSSSSCTSTTTGFKKSHAFTCCGHVAIVDLNHNSIGADLHNVVKLGDPAPILNQSFLAPASSSSPSSSASSSRQWTINSKTEFDKYSILVVFTLFQALLSVASMIQQLSQDKPFGTFLLIELSNVALDFGQGLVTFLVIGLQVISLKDLFCLPASTSNSTAARRQRSPINAQETLAVV